MKKIITIVLVLALGVNSMKVSAQQTAHFKSDSLNSKMKEIAKPESVPNWIKFKDDVKIDPITIFSEHKSAFNLKQNDKMVLYETVMDDLGFTHYRFQQYYKNIKIDGGAYQVHKDRNGIVYAANGKLLTDIEIGANPQLTDKQAISFAMNYVNAKEYRWQSDFWENDLKEKTSKSDTSYYPKPLLVIRKINRNNITNHQEKQCFLVYRIDIYSSSPLYSQRIFIDANTGEVLDSFPLQSN